MRLPRPTPLVAALLLAAGTCAQAQSLKELYDAARAYDATYLAARALADSAQYRVAQAEALANPSAQLSGSANVVHRDQPTIVSSVQPPVPPSQLPTFTSSQRQVNGDINNIGVTLSGRYPLFNRANEATIAQARKSLEVATAELDSAEQDLIVRLTQAYFDVLAAQDTLATTRAAKAAITEQLASAKRNFEVGTATITDTREAQARFDLATAQEIAAENDLRTKRIALDQLVGRTGVEPKGLATPVVLPATQPDDAERWVGDGAEVHPAIRRARLGLDVARLESDKARAAKQPTVDAVGSLDTTRTHGGLVGAPGQTTSAAVGVQLTWPLYTGGAAENRVKEAVVLEEKSRNDLEAARRAVAQGTRQAFFGVQSGQAQVKALEAAEASSKLALEATQLGYRVGVRVNLDVLNAQTQLYQTQRDLARARYDVIVGGLRLRQASGLLTPEAVQAVNALLQK
jgi:outer membrane protein